MKKLLVTTVFLFSLQLFSQSYKFTQSSGTYTNLSSSTSVVDWQKIPIGFTFKFFNQNYDSLEVRTGGYIFFFPASEKVCISAYDVGDVSKETTSTSYQLSGTAGNRILKLEWENMILNNNPNEYINCQMWLYETTNCFDIFIGPNGSMPMSSYGKWTGPGIGFGLPESQNSYNLIGNPDNPNFVLNSSSHLEGTPSNGTIYSFCESIGIFEHSSNYSIIIFPNPSPGLFNLETSEINYKIIITNVLGEIVLKSELINRKSKVDLTNLPKGIYVARINNGRKNYTEKIVIQ